jgi:hypothetical protein
MFAQAGLSDPTGGFFVLLAWAVMAALGLTLCLMGVIRLMRPGRSRGKAVLLVVAGLTLASPALWLAYILFI